MSSVVSPHLLRLLQLIREGTPAHAQLAISQLRQELSEALSVFESSNNNITQEEKDATFILIWDVMGRIQQYLVSHSWSSRRNAAQALQQLRLLVQPPQQANHNNSTLLSFQSLDWSHILQKGRPLYAVSADQFRDDWEERQINQKHSMIDHRMQLQRQILAQKLGWTQMGVVWNHNDRTSSLLPDVLPQDRSPTKKRRKKRSPTEKQDPAESSSSYVGIRDLLVQHSTKTTHECPHILYTELVYRMFDPVWYIRHGAIWGLLSLVPSNPTKKNQLQESEDSSLLFWQDVLVRAFAILALDRFADYGSATVAPVREVAGQLIAVLYDKFHSLQTHILDTLQFFMTYRSLQEDEDIWEIRQGALLTAKFIAATDPPRPELSERLRSMGTMLDSSDDVKAAYLQLLRLLSPDPRQTQDLIQVFVKQQQWYYCEPAYLPDLMALLVRNVAHIFNTTADGSPSFEPMLFWNALLKHLQSDSTTVLQSALELLEAVLEHLAVASPPNDAHVPYFKVVSALYHFFLSSELFLSDKAIQKRALQVWEVLCKHMQRLLPEDCPCPCFEMINHLLCFFLMDLDHMKWREFHFARQVLLSRPLARLFSSPAILTMDWGERLISMMETVVTSFLGELSAWEIRESCLVLLRDLFLERDRDTAKEFLETIIQKLDTIIEVSQIDLPETRLSDVGSRLMEMGHAFREASREKEWEVAMKSVVGGPSSLYSLTERPSAAAEVDHDNSVREMRFKALVSATRLAGSPTGRITPFIRSLVTSLNNENCFSYLSISCDSLKSLMISLFSKGSPCTAFRKIVRSLCSLTASPNVSEESYRLLDDLIESVLVLYREQSGTISKSVLFTIDGFREFIPPWFKSSFETNELPSSLNFLGSLIRGLRKTDEVLVSFAETVPVLLVQTYVVDSRNILDEDVHEVISSLIALVGKEASKRYLSEILRVIRDSAASESSQYKALCLLDVFVSRCSEEALPFIRSLMSRVMTVIKSRSHIISEQATRVFGELVRLGPLSINRSQEDITQNDSDTGVLDLFGHLIAGNPLPDLSLPPNVDQALSENGLKLRPYQKEGIAWLDFLQKVNLGGALTDDMGR